MIAMEEETSKDRKGLNEDSKEGEEHWGVGNPRAETEASPDWEETGVNRMQQRVT